VWLRSKKHSYCAVSLFSAVYWQHTARALTVMLQFIVQEFVGADAKNWDVRLSAVIDEFRRREDIDALQWLVSVVKDPRKIKNAKSREVLEKNVRRLAGWTRLRLLARFRAPLRSHQRGGETCRGAHAASRWAA